MALGVKMVGMAIPVFVVVREVEASALVVIVTAVVASGESTISNTLTA